MTELQQRSVATNREGFGSFSGRRHRTARLFPGLAQRLDSVESARGGSPSLASRFIRMKSSAMAVSSARTGSLGDLPFDVPEGLLLDPVGGLVLRALPPVSGPAPARAISALAPVGPQGIRLIFGFMPLRAFGEARCRRKNLSGTRGTSRECPVDLPTRQPDVWKFGWRRGSTAYHQRRKPIRSSPPWPARGSMPAPGLS
jgi:hypothetical protein